ncbi:MAG: NAD(P)-dependent glycerol-3-phosphate dehydrogenase, partial [Deltaproteobacteria bacterium]|nr:NAD(P)-dependent glycerol-3-phosphate dehydrogenase [Deltaproteobacteria bacterium]
VGRRLAAGETTDSIVAGMSHVAEGVTTTAAVHHQALSLGLDLHVVRTVYRVLYEGISTFDALEEMMAGPVGEELEALQEVENV